MKQKTERREMKDTVIKAPTITADPRDMQYFWVGSKSLDIMIRLQKKEIPDIIDALMRIKDGKEEQRMKTEVETGLHAFGVTMEEIAKARADEREKVLREVLEMVKHQRLSPKDGYFTDERKRHQNSLRAELRAKLNQLKGIEWVGVFAPNGGHAPPNNPYPLKRKE